MDNLCVVGLGYVGLTFSIHSASKGYKVHGLEVNKEILSSIRSGKAHFYEPGIDKLIKKFLNKEFTVSNTLPDRKIYDFIVIIIKITIPTSTNNYTMEQAVEQIKMAMANSLSLNEQLRNEAQEFLTKQCEPVPQYQQVLLHIVASYNRQTAQSTQNDQMM